jgi:hypothetical protein
VKSRFIVNRDDCMSVGRSDTFLFADDPRTGFVCQQNRW